MARAQILTLPNSWCSWQGRFLFASIWGSLLCMIWKVRCPGGKMERLRAKRRCFSFWDLNRARKLFRPFHQTGLAHRVVSFGHVGSDAYQFFRVGLPRFPKHLLGLSSTLHHGTGVVGLVPLHAHLTHPTLWHFDMVGGAANSNTLGTSTYPCTSKVDKPLRVATWVSKKNRQFFRGIGEAMSFWQSSNSHPWNGNTNHQCPRHGPRLFAKARPQGDDLSWLLWHFHQRERSLRAWVGREAGA